MKQKILGLVCAVAMVFTAITADAQGRGWKKGHYKHYHKHHRGYYNDRGYYSDRNYRGSYYYGRRAPRPVIVAPPPPPRPVFIAPPPPPRPPHPFHR